MKHIKWLRQSVLTLVITMVMLILAGCPTPLYQASSNNISAVRGQVEAYKANNSVPTPVETQSGMYANPVPINQNKGPVWLQQHVSLHGVNLPFNFYITKIAGGSNIDISYDPGVAMNQPITIDYAGTIKGALDTLARVSGYAYKVEDNTIAWSNMISKTFDISFMPGNTEYLVGGQAVNNTDPVAADTGMVYFGDQSGKRNQYSNIQGNISVWEDLSETLNKLKSPDGQVVVSQATTTVTVFDHPHNVSMIADYLNQLNQELSRQVALQIKVLQIDLNRNFNYGIDWNLVRKVMGVQLGLTGSLSQPVSVDPVGNNLAPAIAGVVVNGTPTSSWAGTQVLINALKQQGNVSVVTEPRVVTLNNQVAEIGINTLTGYLQQVSVTFTGINNDLPTQSLTPGVVKTGFSLYILPKIVNDHVYLQISSNISNLQDIQRIGPNSTNTNPTGIAGTSLTTSQIQVPTVNEKTFNQRSLVTSGDTLIVAGFKELLNQTANTAIANIPASQGAANANSETIILITPTILS